MTEEGWTVLPLPPTKPSERVLNWAEEFLAGQYQECETCHGKGHFGDRTDLPLMPCSVCAGGKVVRPEYLSAEMDLLEEDIDQIGEELLLIKTSRWNIAQ